MLHEIPGEAPEKRKGIAISRLWTSVCGTNSGGHPSCMWLRLLCEAGRFRVEKEGQEMKRKRMDPLSRAKNGPFLSAAWSLCW